MNDPIFQRSLQDLINGIRSNKKDPSSFISQSISEIKTELRSTDPFLKAEAVRKLTYLQMIGYNISWASFSIVEVMSQPKFAHKRIGYLAANQSFSDSTDVILLTTNLFKKEFASATNNQYEIGLAINCLGNIATLDLARDCMNDIVTLMNHSRPYVRKKAVLAMYKLYVKFPQGLRLTFDKIKDRLDDSENSVVSCAVNVICELANKNPRNYLALAPKFFRLLTTSSNNWMLIKVVKLLGSLVSEEPRLGRKLLEPLATIIQNTGAKSLQYECIHTIAEALPYTRREDGTDAKSAPAVVKLCSDYLRGFIEDVDQNLKYLGLVGLVNLMRSQPRAVIEHRDLILRCLTDEDTTIRIRALELLAGIVSRKSLVDLVHHLLEHAKQSEGLFRDEIISKVLFMCSKDRYALVSDFAWYFSVLLGLSVMQGNKHGKEAANQLVEIALRVDAVRSFAVDSMLSMLLNDSLILGQARTTVCEVLKAAAWVVGEYSETVSLIAQDVAPDDAEGEEDGVFWIEGPSGEDIRSVWRGQPLHVMLFEALLNPQATNLPVHVQSAYLQACMKIFVRASQDCEIVELSQISSVVRKKLGVYLQSASVEVQERASTFRRLLSDLGVLSLTWQAEMAEIERVRSAGKNSLPQSTPIQNPQNDLLGLSFPPPQAISVQPSSEESSLSPLQIIDHRAALQIKRQTRVLSTLTAEPFYAVHSKAQRRVPVPEGLDLEEALNPSSLAKLLAIELPQGVGINNIFFTSVPAPSTPSLQSNSQDEKEKRSEPSTSYSSYSAFDSNPNAVPDESRKGPSRSSGDNMFILSGASRSISSDLVPLSQMLAETFEDDPPRKDKKGRKKDKKDKKERGLERSMDARELLPAGARESDEDDAPKGKHKPASSSKKFKDTDLGSVDFSEPIRAEDAVFLQGPKHRETPAQVLPSGLSPVVPVLNSQGEKEEKKAKKSKKEKEPKEKKKDKKEKSSSDMNLLELDWTASSPAPVSGTTSGHEKKSKTKSFAHSHPWMSLPLSSSISPLLICYSLSPASPSSFKIHFRVATQSSSPSVSIDISLDSPPLPLVLSSRPTVSLAQALPPGQETYLEAFSINIERETLASLFAPSSPPLQLTCSLRLSARSSDLLGASPARDETHSLTLRLPASLLSFEPHPLDEEGFSALLTKSSSRWTSSSFKLALPSTPSPLKPKYLLRLVALGLTAHTVETESGDKAASLSCRAPGGSLVCCLVKASSHSLSVDLKVLAKSKELGQPLCAALSETLKSLALQ